MLLAAWLALPGVAVLAEGQAPSQGTGETPVLPLGGSAVRLKNAGFEEGMKSWHAMPATRGATVEVQKGEGHTGKGLLKLTGEEGQNPWAAQGFADLKPRGVYGARVWVRREAGTGQAAIKLEFYDAHNRYLSGVYGLMPPTAGKAWEPVEVRGPAPEGSAKAAVILRLIGPGTVYFDDLAVSLVQPPPGLILAPARRALPAQGGAAVTLGLQLLTSKPTAEPTALLSGGPLPRSVSLEAKLETTAQGTPSVQVTLPAKVQPGAYKLQVLWGELEPAGMELVLLPHDRRPALMDARGRFLREGQPRFVLGLYHVAPAEFASVAKAGFNVAVMAPPASGAELQEAVQAAREAKLAVAVPLYPALQDSTAAEAALELVKAQSGNPAIFGWLLADEPELKPAQAEALPDLYLRVRQADDVHPALLNLGPGADLGAWTPLADALLVNLLPATGEPPEAVGKRIQTVAAALRESNRSWIGVLPAGWSGYMPTTAQARSYLYQLLAAGAQGVFWFSLREGKWDLTKAPLWEDLPKLNAEAQELAEALTDAQEWSEIQVSVKAVTARGAKRDLQAWLMLFNPTDEAVSGYLRVPEPVAQAEYLDGGQLKINNRTLNFEVPAAGARAVRLSLEAKPATTPPP